MHIKIIKVQNKTNIVAKVTVDWRYSPLYILYRRSPVISKATTIYPDKSPIILRI